MNEIKVFENVEFGTVRTMNINGEPWFVGKDVAEILGYNEPRSAVSKKVDAEDKGVAKMDTPSGMQEMTIINESGLYSLIMSSKLPNAKKFKKWVTGEVLPSIRKTGSYSIQQKQDSYLIDDKVERAKRWIEEQEYTLSLARQIEADKPFTEHGKIVSNSTDCVDFAEFAKITNSRFGLGRNKLFEYLRNKGVLTKDNIPYQKYINAGLFKVIQTKKESQYGTKVFSKTIITGKGQHELIKVIDKWLNIEREEI